ncbi:MAG: DJ-1/PfpI family protein [Candidatus Babeliaceae bacterium]
MKQPTVALVIAHKDYQPKEYSATKNELIKAGITVITASNKPGTATAADHSQTPVDITPDHIDLKTINGIFLIGGAGALENLDTPQMHHILQKARALKIAYGAICVSPRILAKAGVLQGINATGWDKDNQLTDIFQTYGVNYAHSAVVIDGLAVTATGPDAAHEFGKAIVQVVTQIP